MTREEDIPHLALQFHQRMHEEQRRHEEEAHGRNNLTNSITENEGLCTPNLFQILFLIKLLCLGNDSLPHSPQSTENNNEESQDESSEESEDEVEDNDFLRKREIIFENSHFRVWAQQTDFKNRNLRFRFKSLKFSLKIEPKAGMNWPLLSDLYEAIDEGLTKILGQLKKRFDQPLRKNFQYQLYACIQDQHRRIRNGLRTQNFSIR
jgi:hypothetical protein